MQSMENYNNEALVRQTNLPELIVRNIFCGFFSGRWKSALPVNRLIFIIESGAEPSRIGDRKDSALLTRNSWLFIPAFHEVEHDQKPGLKLVSVHFNLAIHSQIELLSECQTLHQGKDPELRSCFLAFPDRDAAGENAFVLKSILWNFLAKLSREDPAVRPDNADGKFSRFTPLLENFARRPDEDFPVSKMAAIMKMGKDSFIKHFTAETGVPPKRFFHRMRAAAAARALADPQTTVREIAERFHFTNEFYFSRFFKRHFGSSPRDYRKGFRL